MTNQPENPDPPGFRSDDDIDDVLGYANPNPERVGCPAREILSALAKRELPIGDPGYEHLINCSPCYREFRALQQTQPGPKRNTPIRPLKWLALAAVLALVVGGTWFAIAVRQDAARSEPPTAGRPDDTGQQASAPALQTRLDLREYTVTRSERAQDQPPPLALLRRRLYATVLLPVGFEPGRYELQLLDSELRPRASALGVAEIRDHVTTLEAVLDLEPVTPGTYQLALRREGEDWRLFPAKVQ